LNGYFDASGNRVQNGKPVEVGKPVKAGKSTKGNKPPHDNMSGIDEDAMPSFEYGDFC
jgi:hypothetical protein